MSYIYYYLFILLIYCAKVFQNKKNLYLYGVEASGGLCNKLFGIASSFLLSKLTNRKYHSIYNYLVSSNWKYCKKIY